MSKAKSIVFSGVPCRDIMFYIASLLKVNEKKILLVTFTEDSKEKVTKKTSENERKVTSGNKEVIESVNDKLVYYRGMDWLTCMHSWFWNYSKIIVKNDTYDYILYEVSHELLLEEQDKINADMNIVVANGYEHTMEFASNFILNHSESSLLILRDICNKRFNAQYFMKKYPACFNRCQVSEIWLDTYDTYYYQCLEHNEIRNFMNLSADMSRTLQHILCKLENLSKKQVKVSMKKLMKGGTV